MKETRIFCDACKQLTSNPLSFEYRTPVPPFLLNLDLCLRCASIALRRASTTYNLDQIMVQLGVGLPSNQIDPPAKSNET